MEVTLHLCAPEGDALRQIFEQCVEVVKSDNCCVISAMLSEGMDVPDTMVDMGLKYKPASGAEKFSAKQHFYGYADLLDTGVFACGSAAAWEAAVMEIKYGLPSSILVVDSIDDGDNPLHALYVNELGVVDPTAEWLDHWSARASLRSIRRKPPLAAVGDFCQLIPGTSTVECKSIPNYQGCCIVDGVWSCPANPAVDGLEADIRKIQTRNGKRWALLGNNHTPAPMCGGSR